MPLPLGLYEASRGDRDAEDSNVLSLHMSPAHGRLQLEEILHVSGDNFWSTVDPSGHAATSRRAGRTAEMRQASMALTRLVPIERASAPAGRVALPGRVVLAADGDEAVVGLGVQLQAAVVRDGW